MSAPGVRREGGARRAALIAKTAEAKQELDEAEGEIERLLAELHVSPRPEKVTITPMLQHAFAKLRSAKLKLLELEATVAELEE